MKKFLVLVGILAFAVPAFASVGLNESTSIKYLDNYGYSDATNNYIQMQKSMMNGRKYYPNKKFRPEEKYYTDSDVWNDIVDGTRAFFEYLDPSLDANRYWWRRDIKFYSNVTDAY